MRHADQARDRRDWAQAALGYRAAINHIPDRPAIWVQYGHALKESGYLHDAELAYRRAIALNSTDADSFIQLGHALKLAERREEAREAYKQAYRLDPSLAQTVVDPSYLDHG
ncbi:tetratricopeptide repeat protein [Neoasaia chiangmaiensis]|nr:tetratricopeptide repeat protein [Neoasaia chiangmaiensis]